jgi:hypothetical protein
MIGFNKAYIRNINFRWAKSPSLLGFRHWISEGLFEQATPGGAPTRAHCGEKGPAHRPRPPPGEAGMGAVRSSKRRTIGRHNAAVSSGRPRRLRPISEARRGCPTPKRSVNRGTRACGPHSRGRERVRRLEVGFLAASVRPESPASNCPSVKLPRCLM